MHLLRPRRVSEAGGAHAVDGRGDGDVHGVEARRDVAQVVWCIEGISDIFVPFIVMFCMFMFSRNMHGFISTRVTIRHQRNVC